jgi:parallel beta-helix repeat protein
MKSKVRFEMLQAAMGLVLIGGLTAGPATAAKWEVDDDGAQCPGAAFLTLQDAVAAASPGDKIKVCPGLYLGPVVISKPKLTLKGAGGSPETRIGDPVTEAVVTSCSDATSACRGFDVRADPISADVFGPAPERVTIEGFTIIDTGEQAIQIGATATGAPVVTRAKIKGNRIIDAGAREGTTNPCSTTLPASQVGRGVNLVAPSGSPVTDHTVQDNVIEDSCQVGIRLDNVSGNTLQDNHISGSRTRPGIALRNADNNAVSDNEVEDNTNVNVGQGGGISLDIDSTGNLLTDNEMAGNLGKDDADVVIFLDAEDDSLGSETAGTANTWLDNECDSSAPIGLCEVD